MGSCPAGFTDGVEPLTCRKMCPPGFKFVGPNECVFNQDNQYRISVTSLPMPTSDDFPQSYSDEMERFGKAMMDLNAKFQQGGSVQKLQEDRAKYVQEYESIQSQAAAFRAGEDIRKVSDSLKPMRPPTAPAGDIEKERKAITSIVQKNFLLIQISLFIILACLIVYMLVPAPYSHNIAFLLLSVNIAVGFFLWK